MGDRFRSKVALVTGGSSGIGRATALAFAQEGAKVVVADVAVQGGEETVRLIKADQGSAVFVRADVSQAAEVEAMVRTAVETYGRLDVAVNNAGILQESIPAADIPEEAFDRVIAINLKSVYLGMKYEIAQMLKQGGGAIVNTASAAALIGFQGLSAYVASKHGVAGLTKAAALDYARSGIRINAVAPGAVRTPMVGEITPEVEAQIAVAEPIGRIGEPEEIAQAILYMASDAASFIVGHMLAVDGGMVIQ
ncbi:MAG: SDR family oxidoreductase [Chloroflexi bacterium]|nr:SDR family oxidoreductase [Chloroflexota bacterium]